MRPRSTRATAPAVAPRPGPPGLPRLLTGLDSVGDTMTMAEHHAVHGPLPRVASAELIAAVERAGLRGRGGADFPTSVKLRAVAGRRRGPAALVVNGSETEPASGKDRLLLTRLPHLVLDGAVLAAEAVGASEVIIKVDDSLRPVVHALEGAIAVRSEDRVSFELVAGP